MTEQGVLFPQTDPGGRSFERDFGISYVAEWLAQTEAEKLAAFADAMPWDDAMRRRVQHYGWRYDYRNRSVRPEDRLGPLPAILAELAERLAAESWFPEPPDQAIINEYLPGQGIASHTDCAPCFGGVVASVSLLSAVPMELRPVARPEAPETVWLAPRSLLALHREARYEWTHGIRGRKSDLLNGRRVFRRRRISVTFRKARPGN